MITQYAQDTSRWEDWKKDYKYGALYIFPPKNIRESVNSLRQKYDPKGQAICEAHISLSLPFPEEVTRSDIEELKEKISGFKEFEVAYGPLRTYLPYPGVCYSIEPQEIFSKLRDLLHSAGIFKNAGRPKYEYSPHMTIAEFISVEETKKLFEELTGKVPVGSFRCSCVSYAVPDENFHFTEREFINF